MKVKKLMNALNSIAPPVLAEKWDNVGLQTGDPNSEITSVAITLDMWPETIKECIRLGCNTIISHHPLIFKSLKRITPGDYVSDTLISLITNKINYIAAHTNLDFTLVSSALAEKCGAKGIKNLSPVDGAKLSKLVVFVPTSHRDKVRDAIFKVGAGQIGNYSDCSFSAQGEGTFRGNETTKPFLGKPGELECADEARIEVVLPSSMIGNAISSARNSHPYEEMAYDVYSLDNKDPRYGFGVIGVLEEKTTARDFITDIKGKLNLKAVRVAGFAENRKMGKIAFAGGSAFECYRAAASKDCDAFVVGECRYHEFFSPALKGPMLIEIGHGESEFPVVDKLRSRLSAMLEDVKFVCLEPQYPSEII